MRRHDLPRESKPKKRPVDGAAPPETCAECAFVFTEEAVKRGARSRKRKDGTAICRDDRSCRVRKLNAILGQELGAPLNEDWLFFRYPRDLVRRMADVRPKDWKKDHWLPRRPLHDRVMALTLYCSWCYPVSLPFAVQLAGLLPHPNRKDLDDDHILLDVYYQPRPLREKDICTILNEHQSNVSRAIKRLVDTKELRIDEDRAFYPAAMLAELSIAERQALYRPGAALVDPDDELRGVPKRFLSYLALFEQHLDPDISTEIFEEFKGARTAFNNGLKDLRTERDHVMEQARSRGATLLPEGLDPASRAKPSVSPRASKNTPAVMGASASAPSSGVPQSAVQPPHRSVGPFSGVVDEGKGALGKLDRPRERRPTDRPSGTDNPFTPQIREWLEATFTEIPTSLEDRELDQIAATIQTEPHLKQFQKAAKRQKGPRGWKVFVTIAVECQKHQGKYGKQSEGKEESYFERTARELVADRTKGKG